MATTSIAVAAVRTQNPARYGMAGVAPVAAAR